MKDPQLIFHRISYLQYPCMLIGLYFGYAPLLSTGTFSWEGMNQMLIFIGLGVSFSTLQDTTKTQNKLSKRVWSNPKSARRFLIYQVVLIVFMVTMGLVGLFVIEEGPLQEISVGVLVLGVGMMGMLKASIEMAANHHPEAQKKRAESDPL